MTYIDIVPPRFAPRAGKEAAVAHGRDKPAREKRKPKKDKSAVVKSTRDTETLQHVQQHGQNADQKE